MFKKLKAINYLVLGLALLLYVLSASTAFANASPPNPLCILADDFGDLLKGRHDVKASGEGSVNSGVFVPDAPSGWLDTNMDLIPGASLRINTIGEVHLCAAEEIEINNIAPAIPTESNWQPSGIYVKRGERFKISVSGAYSGWPHSHSSCHGSVAGKYNDRNCWAREGKGIFAYIGDSPPASSWYGDDSQNGETDPEFFELFSYSYVDNSEFPPRVVPDVPGFEGQASRDGEIYIRYRGGSNSSSDFWDGDYSDNRSSADLAVTITQYSNCKGVYGKYLFAYVGDSPPDNVNMQSIGGSDLINLGFYSEGDDTVDPVVPPGAFSGVVPGSGDDLKRLWLKVFDVVGEGGDGDYTPYEEQSEFTEDDMPNSSDEGGSNFGKYTVDIVTRKPVFEGFSFLVNGIIDPVRDFLMGDGDAVPPTNGITKRMYEGVTENVDFIAGVRAAMVLSIVFFAFSYMVGLSNITQREFIYFSIKMGVIITLIGPTSWEFFYEHLFVFFVEGTDDLIRLMTSQFQGVVDGAAVTDAMGEETVIAGNTGNSSTDAFAFLNQTLSRFFTSETNIKILGLMSSFPIGFIIAILLYVAMGYFIYAVLKAILLYLMSLAMVALLLFLAPIFIPFILFNSTKGLFDNWLKQLISFAIQPVLLFTVLAIFNVFIFSAFYTLLSFSVCFSCVFELDLPLSEILFNNSEITGGNFDKMCVVYSYVPWGFDSSMDVSTKIAPVGLFIIFIFLILTNAMLKFIDWISEFAGHLASGTTAISLNEAVSGQGGIISQAASAVKTTGNIGLSATSWTIKRADQATMHVGSDLAKKAVRSRLPSIATRGGDDGMGGKNKYSRKFMTSNEKRALRRKQKAYGRLDKQGQEDYRYQNKQEQKEYKHAGKGKRKRMKKERERELKLTGRRHHSKSAKEYLELKMDGASKEKLREFRNLSKGERRARRKEENKLKKLKRRSANYDDKGNFIGDNRTPDTEDDDN